MKRQLSGQEEGIRREERDRESKKNRMKGVEIDHHNRTGGSNRGREEKRTKRASIPDESESDGEGGFCRITARCSHRLDQTAMQRDDRGHVNCKILDIAMSN